VLAGYALLGRRIDSHPEPRVLLTCWGSPSLVGDRLWNATIGFFIMTLFPRSSLPSIGRGPVDAAANPSTASTAIPHLRRKRAGERVIRNLGRMMRELADAGAGCVPYSGAEPIRTAPRDRCTLEETGSPRSPEWSRLVSRSSTADARSIGLSRRQFLGLLPAWGRQPRKWRHARNRQLHDRGRDHAHGADHEADPARHTWQGLVVGMQSTSAFARIFQSAMAARHAILHHRQRMVAGRCSPYGGHKAHSE